MEGAGEGEGNRGRGSGRNMGRNRVVEQGDGKGHRGEVKDQKARQASLRLGGHTGKEGMI